MNFFNRLLIWQKFTLGFIIIGFFFSGIVIVYHFSMKQVEESYEQLIDVDFTRFTLGYQISHSLAQMRDVEYNFRINPSDSLAEDHQNYFKDFLDKLARLTSLEEKSGNEEDLKAPKGIFKQINVYRDAFTATVNAWKVKGFNDHAGLRKKILDDAQRFEQIFKQVNNIWDALYQIRHYENAYLRTKNKDYAEHLPRLIDEIQQKLVANAVSDDKAAADSLATYQKDFLAMVEQDSLIQERIETMEEANQAIEFLVEYHFGRVKEDMKKASGATQKFGRDRTRLAFIMASVLILLMILIAFLLVNSLVHPISKVTKAMLHVAGGNMDSQVPVMGSDELGQMATIFNQMARQLSDAHTGLQNEQEKLMTILLSAREGIIGTNRDGKVVLVNPAALRLLGKTEEKIIEDGFLHILDDPDYVQKFLERSGFDMPEIVVYGGKVLHFFAASIKDKTGEIVGSAALIRDVTEEKKLEQMLRDLSYTDGLTKLLNRRRFDELLLAEFQRARRYGLSVGLLLFDVDHFKKFNDTYGHDQGDRVLQAIAVTMKNSFRDVDFCCRYGGEEFCIITPNTSMPGLFIAADRFREKVEAQVIDGLKVTISIGAVAYPLHIPDIQGPAEMLKAADDALYVAKKSGRNQVCVAQQKEKEA
ncbi:MAG: diguanylate cyclase [Magnetococcus sp. DMHC-1]|nr:diguanylate cyclase [Magnetococcales bacterium]